MFTEMMSLNVPDLLRETSPQRPASAPDMADDSDNDSLEGVESASRAPVRPFDLGQPQPVVPLSRSRSPSPCPAGHLFCIDGGCDHMPALETVSSSSEDESDHDGESDAAGSSNSRDRDPRPPFQTDGRGRVIATDENQSLWSRMMNFF
jgi:hypothetical protein